MRFWWAHQGSLFSERFITGENFVSKWVGLNRKQLKTANPISLWANIQKGLLLREDICNWDLFFLGGGGSYEMFFQYIMGQISNHLAILDYGEIVSQNHFHFNARLFSPLPWSSFLRLIMTKSWQKLKIKSTCTWLYSIKKWNCPFCVDVCCIALAGT